MTDERLDELREGRLEARRWRAALERLRLMYPTDAALARELDISTEYVSNMARRPATHTPGEALKERIVGLVDEVRRERDAALEAVTTMIQTMHWIEDEVLTREQRHVVEDRWARVERQLHELAGTLTDDTS